MTYYAGIDVSLRTVNICVVDSEGKQVAETRLSSDVQEIITYFDELEYCIDLVGLEAGTLSQYLTYGLQAADFNVVCMEAAMRNKTDKHDHQSQNRPRQVHRSRERDPRPVQDLRYQVAAEARTRIIR
jgi:transposase